MGSTYQTVLVTASIEDVVAADLDIEAWAIPVGRQRTAVVPEEGPDNYVDPFELAARISTQTGLATIGNDVFDSDILTMIVFSQGRAIHRYASNERLHYGTESDAPVGADPTAFAPYGVDLVNLDRLDAALRGEGDTSGGMLAELRHRAILAALNLDPSPLTTPFRWVNHDKLPSDAARLHARNRPQSVWHQADRHVLFLAVLASLPDRTDPAEVGRVLADAIAATPEQLRAYVGTVRVLPGAAAGMEITMLRRTLSRLHSVGTYFVALSMPAQYGSSDEDVVAAAERTWTTVMRHRYDVGQPTALALMRLGETQFKIGYAAAVDYSSTA
jgi:hypothetical protein